MRRSAALHLMARTASSAPGRSMSISDQRRRRRRDVVGRQVLLERGDRGDSAQVARAGALEQGVAHHVARVRVGVCEQHRRYQGHADSSRSRRTGDRPWPPRHLPVLAPVPSGQRRCCPLCGETTSREAPPDARIGGCTTGLAGRLGLAILAQVAGRRASTMVDTRRAVTEPSVVLSSDSRRTVPRSAFDCRLALLGARDGHREAIARSRRPEEVELVPRGGDDRERLHLAQEL